MWSITTLVAPVVGPVLGGWITDNISWPWIFYINVPVGIIAGVATWIIYRSRETPTMSLPIDKIGLFLLVLWVGALQVMLDKGKDLDWFGSGQIITWRLLPWWASRSSSIWELTEKHPVVDLSLFSPAQLRGQYRRDVDGLWAVLRQRGAVAVVVAAVHGIHGDAGRPGAGACGHVRDLPDAYRGALHGSGRSPHLRHRCVRRVRLGVCSCGSTSIRTRLLARCWCRRSFRVSPWRSSSSP